MYQTILSYLTWVWGTKPESPTKAVLDVQPLRHPSRPPLLLCAPRRWLLQNCSLSKTGSSYLSEKVKLKEHGNIYFKELLYRKAEYRVNIEIYSREQFRWKVSKRLHHMVNLNPLLEICLRMLFAESFWNCRILTKLLSQHTHGNA